MPRLDHTSQLPESVETLRDWKLSNSDKRFDDNEFIDGFSLHAKEANELFDKAFADISDSK